MCFYALHAQVVCCTRLAVLGAPEPLRVPPICTLTKIHSKPDTLEGPEIPSPQLTLTPPRYVPTVTDTMWPRQDALSKDIPLVSEPHCIPGVIIACFPLLLSRRLRGGR